MLPKAERNALIHAVDKLEAFGPQLAIRTPAPSRDLLGCANFARGQGAARGVRFTNEWETCSSSQRSDREAVSDHRRFDRAARLAIARLG